MSGAATEGKAKRAEFFDNYCRGGAPRAYYATLVVVLIFIEFSAAAAAFTTIIIIMY